LPQIRQLSQSIVNKIAAGEVIERPASALKECLENSVDAGALRIDVEVGQGGTEFIRISDDGCGISVDDLLLAVASHATSKIESADDLFRVRTLGFRGEALASIAEISRLRLQTRAVGAVEGAELVVQGGEIEPPKACGRPVGTTIEIRDLFFNTPVRRKFMRTTQTEFGHLAESFTRLALSHPTIHFTLKHNDRLVHDLPPTNHLEERIVAFFGVEFSGKLIAIESNEGDIRLSGFVAEPSITRANNRMQYLFLNGRHIRDRSLQHALSEAYRGLVMVGKYPVAFLLLEMPPEMVDVNVHPTKLEVRFQDSGKIYSQLLGTLRKRFLTTDLTHRAATSAETSTAPDPAAEVPGMTPENVSSHRRSLVDWARGQFQQGQSLHATATTHSRELAARLDLRFDSPSDEGLQLHRVEPQELLAVSRPPLAPGPGQTFDAAPYESRPVELVQSRAAVAAAPLREYLPWSQICKAPAIQVQNTYLVTENESGMVIIDQHALHERVLYEQLKQKMDSKALESQRLLVPEPVTLPSREIAALVEAKETLAALGFEIEPFGDDCVLCSAYPAMLSRSPAAELLREMVEPLVSAGKSPGHRELLDSLLHRMACHAAVKAGDRLAPSEIEALMGQWDATENAHHCPHGRPTALIFTREELDRRFKRT
jgi:DNA mismatch repair protein MutL